jgi:hypothetical protein
VEVSDTLEVERQSEQGQALIRIMHERGIPRHEACTWMRRRLIVRTFIDWRGQLFIHLADNQIVQDY